MVVDYLSASAGVNFVEKKQMILTGGGEFSAKFWLGMCRPQFQNGTVG